jgi:hypothetical protein
MTLSQITELAYKAMYSAADNAPIGDAYLRIFLNSDNDDVIFDPTQCATVVPDKNVFHTFEVVGSNVRYDDDSCTGPQQSWSAVGPAHGSDVISGIYVTTGFTGGTTRSLSVARRTCRGRAVLSGGPLVFCVELAYRTRSGPYRLRRLERCLTSSTLRPVTLGQPSESGAAHPFVD